MLLLARAVIHRPDLFRAVIHRAEVSPAVGHLRASRLRKRATEDVRKGMGTLVEERDDQEGGQNRRAGNGERCVVAQEAGPQIAAGPERLTRR
jgi:hypothetical protein